MKVKDFIKCLVGFNVKIMDDIGNKYLPCECEDEIIFSAQPFGENSLLIIFIKED